MVLFVSYFVLFLSSDGGESAKVLVLYVNFLVFSHRLPAGPTFHEKSSKIIGAVPRSPCIVLVIPSTSELSARSAQKNASIFLQACTLAALYR